MVWADTAAPQAAPSQTNDRRSRRRNQRTNAHETSTVVSANGRSTPSRWPRPEDQRVEQPQQRGDHAGPHAEEECGEPVEGEGEQAALEERHQAGGERDAVHGARPHLCLDEAGAVGALVVDVPVPVGRNDRADGQDRQRGQHLEQGWVLGVVRQVVVEDGRHPRRHVHGLVERGRIAPGLEAAQDEKSDERQDHDGQPELSCPPDLPRLPTGRRTPPPLSLVP